MTASSTLGVVAIAVLAMSAVVASATPHARHTLSGAASDPLRQAEPGLSEWEVDSAGTQPVTANVPCMTLPPSNSKTVRRAPAVDAPPKPLPAIFCAENISGSPSLLGPI